MPPRFTIGQRWTSEGEPELGLGLVKAVTDLNVTITFPASGESRQYASDSAPLRRARFRSGDQLRLADGTAVVLEEVIDRDGLLWYKVAGRLVCETELCDQLGFDEAGQRLLAGQVDPPEEFDLRLQALRLQHRRRKSLVRGFVGGRIDLIPHQLYIAGEVAGRLGPRVLLADEVGLGKTIEAGLIVHRLLQTGRAQRVLVIVPEPLVHQWFVELLRRFNLWFHIFDEERCDAIETANSEANPFLDDQWVLCSLSFLVGNARRGEQVLAAGWDILVLDEAHHLQWSPERVSPEYALIESLAAAVPGMLLLTGTPEQLGIESHFARLRLLDPDRYYDLAEFRKELEQYRAVAAIADKLLTNQALSADELDTLAGILRRDKVEMSRALEGVRGATSRDGLLEELVDQHGTGRVMFRNRRTSMSGFPPRLVHPDALTASEPQGRRLEQLAMEFDADTRRDAPGEFVPAFQGDPRVSWLVELLRSLGSAKVLLICRSRAKVEALAQALASRIQVNTAVFHEGLALVQRDRNAAWFAEADGARILLASEIGSEGRNFQFAHHLVLFDLPLDPELLEQRIGRLDRIGQKSEIHIHVPFVPNSSQEVLVRWFHEGLNALESHVRGGRQLLEQFGSRVYDLAQDFHETQPSSRAALAALLAETRAAAHDLATRLEQGRDRLLELNSFRRAPAQRLVELIRAEDQDVTLDRFILMVLEHFGIQVEELAERTYHVGSAGVFTDSFPGLPSAGFTLTSMRARALSREDVQFLTWDHPLVTGALDLILGSEKGNSSLGHWPDATRTGLYLEAIYLLEAMAPGQWHVDRFLPPTPLRVVVDQSGADVGEELGRAVGSKLQVERASALLQRVEVRQEALPLMLEQARRVAEEQTGPIIQGALAQMQAQLSHELARLRELRKVNANVRVEEIELLVEQQQALQTSISQARLRLDSLRLIRRGR